MVEEDGIQEDQEAGEDVFQLLKEEQVLYLIKAVAIVEARVENVTDEKVVIALKVLREMQREIS